MITFNSIIASLAISQSIFLAVFMMLHFRSSTTGKLLILFSACLSAYLLTTIPPIISNAYVSFVLFRLAVSTPAVLWIIAYRLFDDRRNLPAAAIALIAFYLIVNGIGALLYYGGFEFTRLSFFFTFVISHAIMLGFAVHVVYLGIMGKPDDLIESRREVRIPLVIAMGILNAVIIGAALLNYAISNILEINDPSEINYFGSIALSALAFIVCLTLNIRIFSLHADAAMLLESTKRSTADEKPSPIEHNPEESELVQKIKKAMHEEKLYQEMGLTLGRLAEHLSVQDYRLREAINKKMAFRNFNQFLNSFRIAEASKLLKSSRIPIATIALDVGYASLSSFNKAFKEHHGIPPRDFRVSGNLESASKSIFEAQNR